MSLLLKALYLSVLAGAGFTFAKAPTGTATVNVLASPRPHNPVSCLDANALVVPTGVGLCATFTAATPTKGAAVIQNPAALPCGFNPDTFECVEGAGTAFELRGQNNVFTIPETGPNGPDSFFFENTTADTIELMNATGLAPMLLGWVQITD